MKFSANLGFLWKDRPLPEAIRAAKAAGFDAVECHWPYDTPASETRAALTETGLPMLGLNTVRGQPGANGLTALPGREAGARAAIDQAIAHAAEIGAGNVHVMAGFATGSEAHQAYCANLRYASEQAAPHGITLLIEPLNPYDAPGYFLASTGQAADIIAELGVGNLKLMFDCYHVQLIEGDLSHRLERLLPVTSHIQFASVPDRGPPTGGEVDYRFLFQRIAALGWQAPLGAEYLPKGDTDDTLGWLNAMG